MRKVITAVAAGLLAACGGGGGGGGGPAGTALTVTIPSIGTSTALSAAGFASPPAEALTCDFSGAGFGTVTARYAVVVASTAAPICDALTAGREKAGSTAVVIVLGRGRQGLTAPPAIEAGTYNVSSSLQTIGGTDLLVVAAEVVRFGDLASQCVETEIDVASGTVVVDSNSGGAIRGSVSLTLDGGGTVSGTFVADGCAAPITTANVCTAAVLSGVSWSDLFSNTSCVQ